MPDGFDGLSDEDKADAIARLAAAIEYIRSGRVDEAARIVEGGRAYHAQSDAPERISGDGPTKEEGT